MLQNLHIRGFKGFRDFQLTDLSRVTLVGGKNNIGKTSLLESISLFYNIADTGWLLGHLRWRDLSFSYTEADGIFSPLFTDFKMDNSISLEAKGDTHTTKLSIRFDPSKTQQSVTFDTPNSGNTTTPLKTEAITATSYYLNIHYEVAGVGQEEFAIVLRQTPTTINIHLEPHPTIINPPESLQNVVYLPLRTKVKYDEDITRLSQIDIQKKIDRVVSFLQVIEPQLRGLTVVAHRSNATVYADIQGMDRKVPIGILGNGINRMLSIILAIATADNGIVLVDEIDDGIHRSVLSKVWEGIFKIAKDSNCQIIATTHSYECLQAAYNGSSEAQAEGDFSYIRLENHNNNLTTAQFSHEILGAALEHGWEVR